MLAWMVRPSLVLIFLDGGQPVGLMGQWVGGRWWENVCVRVCAYVNACV